MVVYHAYKYNEMYVDSESKRILLNVSNNYGIHMTIVPNLL